MCQSCKLAGAQARDVLELALQGIDQWDNGEATPAAEVRYNITRRVLVMADEDRDSLRTCSDLFDLIAGSFNAALECLQAADFNPEVAMRRLDRARELYDALKARQGDPTPGYGIPDSAILLGRRARQNNPQIFTMTSGEFLTKLTEMFNRHDAEDEE